MLDAFKQIEDEILTRIINRFIIFWKIMSIIATVLILKRGNISNFDWIEITQIILMFSIWIFSIKTDYFSIQFKGVFIAFVIGSIAYLGIIKYGLIAAGFSILPITALFLCLYLNRIIFWCYFYINIMILGLITLAYVHNYIPITFDRNVMTVDFSQWTVFIVTSSVVIFVIGQSLLQYKQELKNTVSILNEQNKQMEYLASYDQLTGLSLLRFAEQKIENMIEHISDENNVAVLFLDVNNFKLINDKYGHEAGDFCLKFIADTIKKIIREEDQACRIGGDEMVVICSKIKSKEGAVELANRLVSEVAKGFNYSNQFINVSVSIGVAFSSKQAYKFKDLKRRADIAMYQAKNNKDHHVVLYSETS